MIFVEDANCSAVVLTGGDSRARTCTRGRFSFVKQEEGKGPETASGVMLCPRVNDTTYQYLYVSILT